MKHALPRRSSRHSLLAVLSVGAFAGLSFGCDGSGVVDPGPLSVGDIQMQVVAGADQIGIAGETLPGPLVVKVLGSGGLPKKNQIVNFVVVEGGGTVFAGASLTDGKGMAQEIWTLGQKAGGQTVEARAVDTQTGEGRVFAVFKATAGGAASGPAQVIVTAPAASLESARSMQLDASVVDASGSDVGGAAVVWTSSDTKRAVVTADGLVRGISPGQVQILAVSGGVTGTSTLNVFDPALPGTRFFSDNMESGSLAAWTDGVDASKHSIVTDPAAARTGSRGLRVDYPSGGDGGWLTVFTAGHDAVHVRYWVRLAPEWRGGTSLVGVYGSRTDDRWSAFGKYGTCPNGTDFFNTFLSAAGGDPGSVGFLTSHPGAAAPCQGSEGAATYTGGRALTPDEWHRVEMEVKANTPGSADGQQRMWIDGELKGTWSGIRFRDSYVLMLNAVQLAFGNAAGAPADQYLFVDDVEISYLDVQAGVDAVASVAIKPAAVTVEQGGTVQLTADLLNAGGAILNGQAVTWKSSNSGVASVDGTGRVSAVLPGTATVTATSGGIAGTATVTVTAAAPVGTASVKLSVTSMGLTSVGESKTMGVTATDKDGKALAASALTWSSNATGVATVNTSGSVTAKSNGQARIIAVYGSAADTATVTVTQAVASVTLTPSSASLTVGGSLGLTAKALDALGVVVQGANMTWTTSNGGVATVDATGRVAAVGAGSATIGVTSSGRSATSSIQVAGVPAPPVVVGGAWPNQPSGFVQITDQPWNALSSNGWGHMNRTSQSRIVTDASAPHSPSSVLEHLYPAGFSSQGVEPAVDWKDLGGASEIFIGFWWKPSNPWQGHSTGINKVLFAMNEGNQSNVVITMRGSPGGPYYLEAFPEGHPAQSGGYLTQNKTKIPVRLGEWHRVEMRVKIAGGIIQWWVDGTLVGDYSGLSLNSGGFGELQIAPTWGGLGGSNKQQTDYFRYDHIFASKR